TLFPYTTLFRSLQLQPQEAEQLDRPRLVGQPPRHHVCGAGRAGLRGSGPTGFARTGPDLAAARCRGDDVRRLRRWWSSGPQRRAGDERRWAGASREPELRGHERSRPLTHFGVVVVT